MIIHCVFCDFRDDVSLDQRTSIMKELCDFAETLDGVLSSDFGPNRDFEKKSQGYDSGFVIRFASKAALDVYAKHPTHQALGGQLCTLTTNGFDGITVFDLDTAT